MHLKLIRKTAGEADDLIGTKITAKIKTSTS